ncbi:MAG: hypothetical protein AAF752_10795 [Bacteroidota bacterium]
MASACPRSISTPHAFSVVSVLLILVGCAPRGVAPGEGPPALVLGTFEDDYGSTYAITETTWHHQGYARYEIHSWMSGADKGYLVAQNAEDNPSAGGAWTRIDWVRLDDMAPYTWAFCLSAYEAATREEAASTTLARTDTPRTGCNGYPFSRMRKVTEDG